LPPTLADYWRLVREFSARAGESGPKPRYYPGSPWFAQQLARPQDRVVLSEKHPDEFLALCSAFRAAAGVVVHERDGYTELKAMLPPPERRALVLIDPPFEAQDEFAQIAGAIGAGLKRLESGVFAVWYPLTQRARVDDFFDAVIALRPPPTLFAELTIGGEDSPMKMKGCGLLVINPPWQFDREAAATLAWLEPALAQERGGSSRVKWLVPEK
jgi:23S rRNA (adenine2030-N6)-methyltransferase